MFPTRSKPHNNHQLTVIFDVLLAVRNVTWTLSLEDFADNTDSRRLQNSAIILIEIAALLGIQPEHNSRLRCDQQPGEFMFGEFYKLGTVFHREELQTELFEIIQSRHVDREFGVVRSLVE